MKFGIFYEHQIPRPWHADSEHRIYREALEQVELADRVGIDYAWEVEHQDNIKKFAVGILESSSAR